MWRSFYVGSVPIIYGSSSVKEIFPDTRTAIEILDYKSPEQLATFLNQLNQNDTEYDTYLRFKTKNGVKNKLLLDLMSTRKWGINNDYIKGNYIDHFECMICNRMNENIQLEETNKPIKVYQANVSHYGCPQPFTFSKSGLLLNNKTSSSWTPSSFKFSYEFAYSQTRVFFDYYLKNKIYNFTSKDLTDRANSYLRTNLRDSKSLEDLK